jgi:hypothetical protein
MPACDAPDCLYGGYSAHAGGIVKMNLERFLFFLRGAVPSAVMWVKTCGKTAG